MQSYRDRFYLQQHHNQSRFLVLSSGNPTTCRKAWRSPLRFGESSRAVGVTEVELDASDSSATILMKLLKTYLRTYRSYGLHPEWNSFVVVGYVLVAR